MKYAGYSYYDILYSYIWRPKVMYDYLVIGSGLFGSVFAHEAKKAGKAVLVRKSHCH